MDSSEGKGKLMDQARAARLLRRRNLNSPGNHTTKVPQTQTGAKTKDDLSLSASEAEYRATLDAMRDAVHVVDRDLRVVLINEKLRKWSQEYNLDVSNAVGRTLFELFPFLSDSIREQYSTVFNEGRVLDTEAYHNIGGKEIIAEVRRLPIFEGRRVVRVVTVIRDITNNKRAEEDLRRSEEKLAEAQKIAGLLSWSRNLITGESTWSDNAYCLLGLKPNQVTPNFEVFLNAVHEDDRQSVLTEMQESINHCRPYRNQLRIVAKDGTIRWFDAQAQLRLNDNGEPVEIIGIAQDITERKKVEEALLESESRYRAVVDNAREGIVVVQDGRLQFFNPYVEATLDRPREELESIPFIEFIHPDDRDWMTDFHTKRLKGEEVPNIYEVRAVDQHGNVKWAENSGLLIEWCGRPATLNFLRDITERKRAEETIQRERDRAQSYLDVAAVMMVAIGADQKISLVNRKACEVLGGREQDIVGKNWFDHFLPDKVKDETSILFNDLIAGKKELGEYVENLVLTLQGEEKLIAWHNAVIRDEAGNIIGTLSSGEDITERKKTQEALQENQERYRRVVEDQTEFIVRWLPGGIRTFVNESYCRYFGISQEQAIGTSCWPLVAENFHRTLQEKIESLTPDNPVSTDEIQVVRQDGTSGWNLWTTRVLFNEHGELMEYQAVGRDITERKVAEEELARQRYYLARAQEIGSIGTWELDIIKNKLIWTDENYRIFRLPLGMDLTYETFLNCVHPEDREYVDAKWKAAVNGEPYDIEHRIVVDGKIKWVREKADLEFDEQSNCVRGIGFTQDITQRRQAEQTLRDSEEKFRQLVENINEVLWLQDVETSQTIFISPAYESIWGQTCQSFYNNPNSRIESIHPEDRQRVADAFAAGRMDGTYCQEYRIVRPDGTTRWIWDRSFPIYGHDGRVERIAGIAEDITKRKEAEEQLRESRERFRHAFKNANVGMCLVDMNGIITRVNGRMCDIFGYEAEQLQGMSVNNIAHPDDTTVSPEFIRRSVSGEIESTKFEKRYFHRDGHIVWCQVSTSLVRNTWGEPLYFISHVQDITERKKAQDAIEDRLQFERLLSTISSRFINLPVCNIDQAIEDGLGLVGVFFAADRVSIGQFVGSNKEPRTTHCWIADGYYPELSKHAMAITYPNIAAMLADKGKVEYEKPEDIPDTWTQEKQFIETTGIKAGLVVALRIGGTAIGAISINSLRTERSWSPETAERLRLVGDIFANALERKRIEGALIESEAKFKSLAEQSPNMIFINKGGRVVYANNRCEEVMGYTREQLYSPDFDFLCLIAPECQDLIKENLSKHIRGEELDSYDYSLIDKNNNRIDAINTSRLIQYEGQVAILGIVTDITERKRAEKELRESEHKFRSYIDNAPDGVGVADRQGRIIEVNHALCRMTGYSRDELLGQTLCYTLVPKSYKDAVGHLKRIAAEGWAICEYEFLRKDGGTGYWSVDAVKISEDRYLGFIKDITANKRAEEALRASEEKFRSIFETAPNLITSVDEKGIIVDCNCRILDILGYQKEEVIGRSIAQIIHSDFLPKAETPLQEILATGFSYNKEYKMVRKDGSLIDVSINSSGLKDHCDRHVRTLCIIDNITDRKKAEQRILENRAQLKSLASKLSLTEERERRRLATELHDHIGQSLVISKIKLDQLRISANSELTDTLGEVCSCLEQVIQDTRMLTFDLSSPILYELGFEAAVAEWLTDEVKNKHGIHIEFNDDGLPKPLDEDIRALLFRNVRELLINTVKHAKAGKVKVSLRKVDKHINVTVEDDGIGFDPVEVRAKAVQRAEFGLFSIRERLEQLGGHLEIKAAPGQGSRITMTAPLKSESNS